MTAPRIVSIDLTHLVEAALRGERRSATADAVHEPGEPGEGGLLASTTYPGAAGSH